MAKKKNSPKPTKVKVKKHLATFDNTASLDVSKEASADEKVKKENMKIKKGVSVLSTGGDNPPSILNDDDAEQDSKEGSADQIKKKSKNDQIKKKAGRKATADRISETPKKKKQKRLLSSPDAQAASPGPPKKFDPKKSRIGITAKIVGSSVKKALDDFVNSIATKGVRNVRREFTKVAKYPPHMKKGIGDANEARNRYDNVACLDDTRVALTLNVPPETDYIHANWVKLEHVDIAFIATQAPLAETVGDFWRLCYQETVSSVVNLCNKGDMLEDKCIQYWPLEVNRQERYGPMQVVTTKVEKESHMDSYTVKITLAGYLSAVTVKLIHMTSWPDRGVPKSFTSVTKLLRRLNPKAGPCVVHCSAGIGRTGAAIAIETLRCRLLKGILVDTKAVLEEIRSKRAQSIQTIPQYLYVVCSVLEYIKMKIPVRYDKRVIPFQQESKKYLK